MYLSLLNSNTYDEVLVTKNKKRSKQGNDRHFGLKFIDHPLLYRTNLYLTNFVECLTIDILET